ncbi:MFS transporter [Pleomorphomonas oryzae]|uniref:MFS transporter n=1 Tax=Pleomorphomonas oryzae TaxID=261934 RepID=UPI00047BA2E3|nr:MFS transporter [Pleomorphomonas oryzae]
MSSLSSPAARPSLMAVLAVVLMADVLDLVDGTLTSIAAPAIAHDLGGGPAFISWLGTAYTLALGVFLVLGGRLGDRFGQRRLFLLGMAGFTLASLVCGLSLTPGMLIGARFVQGAFGALLIPQGMAILTTLFSRAELGIAFSVFGPALGLSAVAGPLIGGLIIDADIAGLGWRPMFLINIVIGVIGLPIAAWVLPKVPARPDVRLDGPGSLLLGLAMLTAIYGLIGGAQAGWLGWAGVSIVASLALFAAFAWRQATAEAPIILASLFRSRGFVSGLIVGFAFFAMVNGLVFITSLFLQNTLAVSPWGTALRMLPMTLGIIVASAAGMALIPRLGRMLVVIGLGVTLLGTGLLALAIGLGGGTHLMALSGALFVLGLGMGSCFGTIYDIALGDISTEEAGSASGSLSAAQQLAASTGMAVMSAAFLSEAPRLAGDGALLLCLAIAAVAILVSLPLVGLMPRAAPAEPAH